MNLSKRLSCLAEMVTVGSRLADVGTDHGYVPLCLYRQGKIPAAIAMDINRGPLERAQEHIRDFFVQMHKLGFTDEETLEMIRQTLKGGNS